MRVQPPETIATDQGGGSRLLADGANPLAVKRVYVVFKTHLDLGFTDFAEAVTRRYLDDFFPRAMAVAKELEDAGGDERLVWTTGSWLVDTFLERADNGGRKRLEQAIAAGHIAWHALPFTTHTELMDPALFTLNRRGANENPF